MVGMDSGYIITVVITGLLVVFLGLFILIAFVSLLGVIFNKKPNKKKKSDNVIKQEKIVEKPVAPLVEDGVSEEIVAVITAAVAAMSSEESSFTIRGIKKAKNSGRSVWAAAGLQDNTRSF